MNTYKRRLFHSRLPRLATALSHKPLNHSTPQLCATGVVRAEICATDAARTEYTRGLDGGRTTTTTTIRVKEADSIRAVTA